MTLCNENNCNNIAHYGIKYKLPLKCYKHKKNMINVMDTLCLQCYSRGIETKANYGVIDKDPVSCFRCSTKKMINVSLSLDKSRDQKDIMTILALYGE